jgi:malto-oligosyltrehalose trehalohydrolase
VINFAHWELPFGATLLDQGHTHFKVWAPAQAGVSLAIVGEHPIKMKPSADGWFEVKAACGAGTQYHYVLHDGTAVPDPASRAQCGDVHGESIVIDPQSYRWHETNWHGRPWHEAIIYELHVGTYGGFNGVARELSRLADLGITAIELMPIAEFPGVRNWGYDGVLPFAPESSYGSPDDLKTLIDAAHAHGMMIFLDVVYNHFGPDGNYLNLYAPQMFRNDVATPWGPVIDFRRAEVRRYFTNNALYWLLEYRFDGLRFDAVHAITEQAWLDEMAAEIRATIRPERHIHLVLENDNNDASHLIGGFDAQWNDDGHHVLHTLLTGETEGYYGDYAVAPATRLARCLKEGFVYQGEPSAHRNGKRRGTDSTSLPPTAFVLFLQNHDQIGNRAFGERLTTLSHPAALKAATALLLLCPQIPLLFMGEEQGSVAPFLFFTDHNSDLANAVREGRRKEFSAFAQFSSAATLAKIPDPNTLKTFEDSKPVANPSDAGLRELLYRELLAVRHTEIIPRLRGAHSLDATAAGCAAVLAHWRMSDGADLIIASNLDEQAVSLSPLQGKLLFATSIDAGRAALNGSLESYSTVALLSLI